ncbi:hypothetical protein OHB93_13055 [Microbacterium sp. No. 7]|uniref:hypothetical protein n=1 Tax=Microbacterium sp. No. 7 TaxID=1714373 RepID=UPI00300918B8
MQSSARAVYDYVEEWLGEDLTVTNAQLVSSWPWEHLVLLAEQWPTPSGADLDLQIPPVVPGELRPVTAIRAPGAMRRRTVSSLLLYAPAIVVPADDLVQDWYVDGVRDDEARSALRAKLEWLARIRGLLEGGTIVYSRRLPGDEWISLIDGLNPDLQARFRVFDDMSWSDWNDAGWSWPQVSPEEMLGINRAVGSVMGTSLELVSRGAGQALSLEPVESIAFDRVLNGRKIGDGRLTALERIGEFEVPDFSLKVEDLMALRNSDDWEDWREALRAGIDMVTNIPADPAGAKEATAILTDHLGRRLFKIDKTSKTSRALSAMRSGSKGFAITGIGAVSATVATGDPTALVAAGPAAIADPVAEYISALVKRRKNRAVLDVLLEFHHMR